jgi:hypothetical protein
MRGASCTRDCACAAQEAETFIYEHLYQAWLAATRALPRRDSEACERDPLAVLSENAPLAPGDPPLFTPPHAGDPLPTPRLSGSPASPSGSAAADEQAEQKPPTLAGRTLPGGKDALSTPYLSASSFAPPGSAPGTAGAWREFEATAIATANIEGSGPHAWHALAAAVARLQAEAAAGQSRQLESARAAAAREIAFIKAECSKVRWCMGHLPCSTRQVGT